MARIKGAKNRSTVIMEELIAKGMDPAEAKIKAKDLAAKEKIEKSKVISTKRASAKGTIKKRTNAKERKEKFKGDMPDFVQGFNATTQGAWIKSQTGKSRKHAIRAHCLMCVGGSAADVKNCTMPSCPLFQFRITG